MGNTDAFVKARQFAEQSADRQERNRIWWETLPMTYSGWEEKDRVPSTPEDFVKIERVFLDGNPWLRDNFEFNAFKEKQVLEIGVGSGCAACLFAKGGADVTGIDITRQSIGLASKNAHTQGLTNIKFQQMDAEHMTFPDNSFDHVFSWGVLHHSQNTEAALAHVGRVLKPGGTGLMMVYHAGSIRFWARGIQYLFLKGNIFRGFGMQSVQGLATDGYYQRHFYKSELKRCLKDAGLVTTGLHPNHMGWKYIKPLPAFMDPWLKRNWGFMLSATFRKP